MQGGGWSYYQNSYVRKDYEIPLAETPSFSQIENEFSGKYEKHQAFFASYITEFDCKEETQWWFTIKDSEYDLANLKAKRRYEITKAKKFCSAKQISAIDYIEELFECYMKAFDAYPEKYRPKEFNFESFVDSMKNWDSDSAYRLYASFFSENKTLTGFLLVQEKGQFVKMVMQKTIPSYEKYNTNAALVDCFLSDWNEKLKSFEIIVTNGSRSIKHETNFNDYLEKYFGFRKAYAKLAVVYKFPFGLIVKILRPFKWLFKNTKNAFLYNVYCVLKMDGCIYR